MEKKYELVMDDTITYDNHILYRIKALRDFDDVKTGDLGGYVSGEHNLSHDGNCWIYDNARVYENGKVREDAKAYGAAKVFECAKLDKCAKICDNAKISGYAWASDYAVISDGALVSGYSHVNWFADVSGMAKITDHAYIEGKSKISGCTTVCGSAIIDHDAIISSNDDYLCMSGLGPKNRTITAYRTLNDDIYIAHERNFSGSLNEFENLINNTLIYSKDDAEYISCIRDVNGLNHRHADKYKKEYLAFINVTKIHFNLT